MQTQSSLLQPILLSARLKNNFREFLIGLGDFRFGELWIKHWGEPEAIASDEFESKFDGHAAQPHTSRAGRERKLFASSSLTNVSWTESKVSLRLRIQLS